MEVCITTPDIWCCNASDLQNPSHHTNQVLLCSSALLLAQHLLFLFPLKYSLNEEVFSSAAFPSKPPFAVLLPPRWNSFLSLHCADCFLLLLFNACSMDTPKCFAHMIKEGLSLSIFLIFSTRGNAVKVSQDTFFFPCGHLCLGTKVSCQWTEAGLRKSNNLKYVISFD